jgi:hypothetical protein
MLKTSKTMEAYKKLGRLAKEPMTPQVVQEIKKAIRGSASLVASRAADIAGDQDLRDLTLDLASAFGKFMTNGATVDKGCRAKIAILKALNKLEYTDEAIYLSGAFYVQTEPGFGASDDTAAGVRSECAFGLARTNYVDAHYVLADMMVDTVRSVRVSAVKAVTYIGAPEGELMLRVKALCGDEPEVLGECLLGLMTMSPNRSLDFVARFLKERPPVMEGAAIALGSSHLPDALQALQKFWDNNPFPDTRRSLVLPIALIRSDDAFDCLVAAVRKGHPAVAAEAVSALRLYLGELYTEKIRAVVKTRTEPEIGLRFAEEFGVE